MDELIQKVCIKPGQSVTFSNKDGFLDVEIVGDSAAIHGECVSADLHEGE